MIAVGASDGTIYGVDKATGKITWKHATGSPVFGSVAASGNALVATDFGGNVYVLLENNMNHNINHLQKMKRTFYTAVFSA